MTVACAASRSRRVVASLHLAAEWLMYYFFRHEILAKGAIAAGRFTANFETSTFCGRPLIDAYLLQDELAACATILHHSAELALDAAFGTDAEVVKPRRIPIALRDGLINHCVIRWQVGQTLRMHASKWKSYTTWSREDLAATSTTPLPT